MKPLLEELESRLVPATVQAKYLIIDCTPDKGTEVFQPGRFSAIFARGQGPDTNGDGLHNMADLVPTENFIRTWVQKLYSPSGYTVKIVDRNCQSNAGQRWLAVAKVHPEITVQVCYLSDMPPNNVFWQGVVGISYEADPNTNLEWYNYVFAGPLVPPSASADATFFNYGVAQAIAHELGHMNGLEHPANQYEFWNVMNAFLSDTPWAARFSNVNEKTEAGTIQNARHELNAGWNQPNVMGDSSLYYFFERTPPHLGYEVWRPILPGHYPGQP